MTRYTPLAPGDHERIEGPRGLLLRPISASDIPNVVRWRNDPEVAQWWGDPPESEAACAEEELETDVNPCWRFVICEDGQDVGMLLYSSSGGWSTLDKDTGDPRPPGMDPEVRVWFGCVDT